MAPQNTRISPLDEALSLLGSSTVTDRNQGVEQISNLLTNPSNWNSIKESRWAEIFHQLFSAADTEKAAILKPSNARKGSIARASNLNRLRAALTLIRKCVVQFVSLFKHKVMKLVINRTIELIVVAKNRTLMDSIVLDCIRILRDFLLYRPHLEHLGHELSAEILAICFASILDRKLPETFSIPDNESFGAEPPLEAEPLNPTDRSQAASPRMIDSCQLLSIVIPASSSVCLECSKSLLFDFRNVLEKFPRDTSAHFHLITALHLLLRELELNRGRDLSRSAIHLGNCLISLWPNKNIALKEQIVLCLTYLLPFVIREAELDQMNSESQASPQAEDLVRKITHVISNDVELYTKSSSISLGTLRLVVPRKGFDSSFFCTKGFTRTSCDGVDVAIERVQAVTWAALRLGASALNHVTQSTHQPSARGPETPSKRRKVESELEIFLQDIQPGSLSAAVVHRIQLLTVTFDLHWENLDNSSRQKIIERVLGLLQSDDPVVVSWAFIFFGNTAHCIAPPGNSSSSYQETPPSDSWGPNIEHWKQIWSYAIHRTANPTCSRMLISECLALASEDIQLSAYALEENVLRWLNKTWPEVDRSTATCNLIGGGSAQRNRRASTAGFDSEAVFQLLVSIAKLPEISLPTPMQVPPDCATTEVFAYLQATQSTRSSIFPGIQHHLSRYDADHSSEPRNVRARLSVHDSSSRCNSKLEIMAILRRSMERISQEFDQKNVEQTLSAVSCSHLQMIIKMLIIVILFQASCQASDSSFDSEIIKFIVSVFDVTIQLVGSSKWSPPERAQLLACVEPIILPSVNRSATVSCDGLARPGVASGIRLKERAKLQLGRFDSDARACPGSVPLQQYEIAASQVWSFSPPVRTQLDAFSKMCERLLQSVSSVAASTAPGNAIETYLVQTQATGTTINFEEEEEEELVVGDTLLAQVESTICNSDGSMKRNFRTGLGSIGTERATLVVASVCVRTTVTCTRTSTDHPQSARPLPLLSMIIDCVGLEVVYIGSPMLDCIFSGWITLTADQADQVLQHLGDTYLSTYTYSQNASVRKLSLQVVQTTLSHWKRAAEGIQEDVELTAHQLVEYMTSQMLQGTLRSWEVQCELSRLLDACTRSNLPQTSWAPLVIDEGQDVVSSRPADLMLWFLEDQDYRVRYRAALYVSRSFELRDSENFHPVEYWRQVVEHLDLAAVQLEISLTATLCMINIFVVSEEIRPRVYHKLLSLLSDPPALPDEVLHYKLGHGLLRRASGQLGFTSTMDLYLFYAAHIARVNLEQEESPPICSHLCVGHRLKRHQRDELFYGHFLAVGPYLYIADQKSFKKCAECATLKEDDALRLCCSAIAAELVARACTQMASSDCALTGINDLIEPMLKTMARNLKLERGIMELESDRVVIHLMRLVHVTPEGLDAISKIVIRDSTQRNVFGVLTSSLRKHSPCEPALPFYPILRIAQGIKWIGDGHSLFTEPAFVYNVLCQTFASLTSCYFTNDRLRPVSKFIQWTIMKALQPSNTELKGHASMAQLIISVADSMKRVANSTLSDPPDIICATEFNSWLLEHVAKTSQSGPLEYQTLCHSLLFNWPESHKIEIEDGAMRSVLGSSTGPTFKMIHHLHSQNFPGTAAETGNILYRLLASAQNLKTEIKVEDCQAYLKLLYQNSGVLSSPRLGESTLAEPNAGFEERSLDSEDEIISRIYAIVVSYLQTYNFPLLWSLTDFLQRTSSFASLPTLTKSGFSLAPLLIEKFRLSCHKSESLEYSVKRVFKSRSPPDFPSLERLAYSSCHWTRGFLHLLVASRARARQFYVQLIPLVESNDELAAKFLPQVLHSCLLEEIGSTEANLRTKVSKHIRTILTSHSTHQDVGIRVLELVTHLRSHPRPGKDPLGNNKWLDVPWLQLAKQATKWRMAASAFLFVEIAREEGLAIDVTKPLDGDLQSLLERLYSISPEPDAFYSLIPSNPTKFLLQRYQHENQWESAFGFHGALVEDLSIKSRAFREEIPSLAGYLSGNGLNRLAHMVLQTHNLGQDLSRTYTSEAEKLSTLPLELAWRASVWDLPAGNQVNVDSSTRIYSSLKSCYRDRENSAQIDITSSCLLGQFKELINSTSARVQPSSKDVGSALALSNVLDWLKNPRKDDFESLVSLPSSFSYDVLERISAVRRSLLQVVTEQKQGEAVQDKIKRTAAREAELKLRIKTSQAARQSGNVQAAVNIIIPFSNLTDEEMGGTILHVKEEFAQVLWAKGEKALALNIMKEVQALQKNLPESAVQLCQIGEWISLARLNSPMEIVDQYFEKAIKSLDSSKHPEALGEISYSYAKFADQQYHRMEESEEMKKLRKSTKRLQAEIKGASKLAKVDGGVKRLVALKERLFEEDNNRLESLSKLQTRYLSSSLTMYLSSISHYDKADEVIFRFVSLWLEHHYDDALTKGISAHLNSVPTHKFIPVANQLSARLSKESSSEFQKALGDLIVQLCQDHPFHVLFQILLLQRGIESSCLDSLNSSRSRRTSNVTASNTLSPSDRSRAEAANDVLSKIVQTGPRKKVIKELLMVHKAYKEWALHPLTIGNKGPKSGSRAQIPAHFSVNSLKDLSIPVSTSRISIDKTRRYLPDSIPCISSYETTFTVASGKSTPKITTCRGSDGIRYKQLFKGGDDARQDAVMEQVFELVNSVLERDPECQKRRLNFKIYMVIPLSPDSGLIEFVKNTSSLLEVLKPVHAKYNQPPDWEFEKLWKFLAIKASAEQRIKRYQEAITHCRPAMRFWFWENQKCPQKWYEMRLNFTRSAATTSIVGHILGLGDRHLSNILIDRVTGEVVQIDLGVAFDGVRS
ncbi:Serine/threonine-protein kinase tel1 [Puccinia graminis f. sp. tritici]|uniref:Serine/threonine-protein kinase TEL1 n=1 Tax=Puccinia graminis f. sp. tritici TaxID=56615 RepID=A0A5B0LZI3_PUCGR|nr:Serine/threonine-protein kinase tel1 [Puccinia graminis f. sp. tritici]